APCSLLEEMENHLTFLEGKKAQTTSRTTSIQSAVSALNSTGSAFTNSISSAHELNGLTVDESMRRAVEEEAAVMNQLKEQRLKELATKPSADSNRKVPSPIPPPSVSSSMSLSPPTKPKETTTTTTAAAESTPAKPASNNAADLMSLNTTSGETFLRGQAAFPQVPFTNMGMDGVRQGFPPEFVGDVSFNTAFPVAPQPTDTGAPFDPFGEVLQPKSSVSPTSTPVPDESESKSSPTSAKLISSDLDSSLQTLVQNLDINGPKKPVK
ncbi:hypothetical protein AVEN_246385-2, partial [Araneus ventricosus]